MVKKERKGCKIDDKDKNEKIETKTTQIEAGCLRSQTGDKPTNVNADKKEGVVSKKSVTLIDNIRSNIVIEYKRDDGQKKQDSKCLRGILKSKSDSNTSTASTVDYSIPVVYDTYKTEEPIPNPCPKYFGIKSYIDSFYYPPDTDLLNSGEYIQDDFEFVVEPGKRRWKNCWFKVGLWGGINLLLLGIIALLVGHLTPPRETIVARVDNLEILDRSAITFNSRLHLCRLSGITTFCIGGIVLMLTLLISSYQQDASYYVMNTAFLPETFSRSSNQKIWASRIPLSSTVKPVQPQ